MYPFSSLSVKKNPISVLKVSADICWVGMEGMARPFSILEIRPGDKPLSLAGSFWVRPESLRNSLRHFTDINF